jgi:putative hydrolase of the HAD superfamily
MGVSAGNGIEAVLFDAGNTLIYVDPVRLTEILRTAVDRLDTERVRNAELSARRHLHEVIAEGHVGTEPEVWRGYFRDLFQGSGVLPEGMEKAGQELRAAHGEDHLWTHVAPGTVEALGELSDAGYRLGVISNADGRVEGVLETVGLRPHFEFVVDSEVVGTEKPDPEIFLNGARRMGLEPRQCLYVGDLYPVDYLGATRAGMQAVLLDPMGLHDGKAPTVATLGELPAYLAGFRV